MRPARCLPEARAMIVAPQPEAVEAGTEILRAGGNALDAAIGCALAQGVVDPMMCGLGGLGVVHLLDRASGRHEVWDGLSTCPAAAREDMFAARFLRECSDGYGYVLSDHANELGHEAVTVPGILAGLSAAHAAAGRLPWRELFAPAMALAREGWLVRPHVASMFHLDEAGYGRLPYVRKLAFTAQGAALYCRPDGTPKRIGDKVVNPALADTLDTISRDGADAFYRGDIAAVIAAEMQAHGGLITRDDLADFRPRREAPIFIPYRGRRIALPPPPAGGIFVAEMLRILERFDLVSLGHNSAEYIRIVAEAMLIAGRDKDEHIGDPDFAPAPLEMLLSDGYADQCAADIRAGRRTVLTRAPEPKGTTTISCVDADGMVVSMTHTLGVPSGVMPAGTGFMLNGAMNWYDPRPGRAGSIAPGKRRYSSMSPSIVFEGEAPVATLGAPGGAWIGVAIGQALINLLDWGMTMQEAVSAPRFSATSEVIDLSNRIPRSVEKALAGMDYKVKRHAISYAFAAVHGITMWDGRLEGGADPQRDGYPGVV
ncbi:gamma-glutamyltransferase [Rhodovarius crocodyli]|nr:gamma-glutamyltransferase [Rhodovarius crocodyli]